MCGRAPNGLAGSRSFDTCTMHALSSSNRILRPIDGQPGHQAYDATAAFTQRVHHTSRGVNISRRASLSSPSLSLPTRACIVPMAPSVSDLSGGVLRSCSLSFRGAPEGLPQ